MSTVAAMSGVIVNLQDTATTGNGTVVACPLSFIHHNFIIKGASGVTAGAVQLETSNQDDYSGTWAPLTASPTTVVGGAEVLVEYEGRLRFVRARISTTISGGGAPSVTVEYEGGKSY